MQVQLHGVYMTSFRLSLTKQHTWCSIKRIINTCAMKVNGDICGGIRQIQQWVDEKDVVIV